MPISRRLAFAILSILLLTIVTGGSTQPIYAQATATIQANVVWVNGPKPSIQLQLFCTEATIPVEITPGDTLKVLAPGVISATWVDVSTVDASSNPCTFSVKQGSWNTERTVFTEAAPPNYTGVTIVDGNTFTITNTYAIPTSGTFNSTKIWVNGTAPRPIIAFQLLRKTSAMAEALPVPDGQIVLLANVTTANWASLEQTDINGLPYVFTVKEMRYDSTLATFVDGPPANYAVGITYSQDLLSATVTNTYTPTTQTTTATATKVWVNGPTVKPTIWFKLYRQIASGTAQEVPITEGPPKQVPSVTPFTVTWNNLAATDIAGNLYTFSVKEGTWNVTTSTFTEGAPTNYQKAENGLTITNSYVSPKINLTGYKVWSGGPAAKPNIQIQLYRNGAAQGNPYTLTSGITNYTWQNMDQTDVNGATYQYTLNEVAVPAYYSKSVNGMTVTNTYTGTLPYTGDNTNNARWLALLLILAAILPLVHWLDLKLLTRRRG